MKFRIGTRKSALAKVQSHWVKEKLESQGLLCELVEIESEGDLNRKVPLYEIDNATPGLFTKQLEVALENNLIDLAVHSLKDLPTDQPASLKVAAVTKRVGHCDRLIVNIAAKDPRSPLGLKAGARVGTSSLRREAQLLSVQPDLKIIPIRGNVPTRVQSVRDGKVDAVVLAEAGLTRLQLDLSGLTVEDLSLETFIPAPGQGALGIETRKDIPTELSQALLTIHDPGTEVATRVERAVLKGLHGGCTLPLGVLCENAGKQLKVKAFLGISEDRTTSPRKWLRFERFDICDAVDQVVVSRTVSHFLKVLEESKDESRV